LLSCIYHYHNERGVYVRCWYTNVLVTLEWYISLIVGATITGILIVNLLSPPSMLRWSKNLLVTNWKKSSYTEFLESTRRNLFGRSSTRTTDSILNDSSGDQKQKNSGNLKALCLRCASEATYQLTSFNIEAVAYILRVDDDKGPVGTFIEPLELMHSKNVVFVSRKLSLCLYVHNCTMQQPTLTILISCSINLVQHIL
jgi:hypothetical protein